MTIKEELAQELKDAMRAQDGPRRDVIRQVETEIAVARSQPDFEGEVDDELYRTVIGAYVKKMDKARGEYLEIGERGAAMAEKLGYEVKYLSKWLPSKLDETATRDLVKGAITELGVAGHEKAAGRVVGHLMKTHGKDLDGGLANRIAREELAPD
ncbi:MAG: GatB/YqeY domain-containing protein [Actinomycetota bacterium]|nr:GatB/YqeY domain-containing protein [Actinomycetota bacterium]